MKSKTKEGRLEYIDVVRWQDRKIHILGRREENISSDASSFRAYHIIHDEQTGNIISEDSFLNRGNFPLFMCGCYILTCEGTCPTLLDDELSLTIHENRLKSDEYDSCISKFKEANSSDLRKDNCNEHKL